MIWKALLGVSVFSFTVLHFSCPNALQAQRQDFLSRGELTLCGGGMFYIGDLNNQSALSLPRLGYGIGLRERLDNRWALRAGVAAGSVGCARDYLARRNLSFRSHVYELSAMAEFNFRPFGPGATESQWTPYLFGGLGIFHFNPEAQLTYTDGTTEWVELQPLRTMPQKLVCTVGS